VFIFFFSLACAQPLDLQQLKPVFPSVLKKKIPVETQFCQKYFILDQKKQEVDSYGFEDAYHIRQVFKSSPSVLTQVVTTEEHRSLLNILSWVSSAGVVSMLIGLFSTQPFFDAKTSSLNLSGFLFFGGGFFTLNALVFGFSLHYSHQNSLHAAVKSYNQINPDRAIQLLFESQF
jgi:hypothetical protein